MEEAKQHVKRNARNTFPTRNNSRNDSNLTSLNQMGSNKNIDNGRRANSNFGGRKNALNDLLPEQEANCSPVSAYYVHIIGEKKELVVVNNDTNHGAATLKRSLSPTPGYFLPNDVEGDLPADFPDFSPLPYEYTIDSNTDGGWKVPPQHHCAAGNDTAKKRQKTLESAWAKRCQQNSGITTLCLPNVPRPPLNHVTCRRESYRTHDELRVHHDEQSTIPHLKEEHKQQHEYLSATLNFPYKDFIANHNKNDSHFQLWCDEEEQSRLEKHFDTMWQVEFFSKFYSGESQSLETPVDDIFGPKPSSSSEKEVEKDNSSANARRSPLSASTTHSEEDDEVVFVSMTSNTFKNSSANRHFPKKGWRTDHSNMSHNEICTSPSSTSTTDSSNIRLEEAAIKLSAAMVDTDKTRDLIACIEKEMQINRDEVLKVRTAYVASSK